MTINDLPFPVDDALRFKVWGVAYRRFCAQKASLYQSSLWWSDSARWPSVTVREPRSVRTERGWTVTYTDGKWCVPLCSTAVTAVNACYRWENPEAHESTYPKLLALRDAAPVRRPLTDEEARCIVEDITKTTGVEL